MTFNVTKTIINIRDWYSPLSLTFPLSPFPSHLPLSCKYFVCLCVRVFHSPTSRTRYPHVRSIDGQRDGGGDGKDCGFPPHPPSSNQSHMSHCPAMWTPLSLSGHSSAASDVIVTLSLILLSTYSSLCTPYCSHMIYVHSLVVYGHVLCTHST